MKWTHVGGYGILALAAAALGAEGLVRARAHARFGPYLDIYEIHERLPASDLLVPMAGLDIEFGNSARVRTDEHGFRSPPVPVPKPGGTLRLAFLGASTTFCSQVSGEEATWPSRVTAALAERLAPVRVDHVNAGVTSYVVNDSLTGIDVRVEGVDPDVVVIYHAANDLAVDTHAEAEAAGLAEPARPVGWLERHSLLWNLVRKNQRFVASQQQGRSDGPKLDCDLEALARGFEERLVALVQRAARTADLVVLVTFATRFDRSQPLDERLAHMEQSFTFMSYLTPEALQLGFEAYNRALVRAAERTGALLIDDRGVLQGNVPCFADSVHLSELGCRVMAQRVVVGLEGCERFRQLADSLRRTAPEASEGTTRTR